MNKVLYPGSFDPITKGHMSIIEQASKLFDEVIVAVLQNPNKSNSFFTIDERINIIKKLYSNVENIKVISSTKASVDIAILNDCKAIIRGLRGIGDLDYEMSMLETNRDISNNSVNTVLLVSDKDYRHVSSTVVKEVYKLGKDISSYVDPYVKRKVLERGIINGK